MDNSLAPRPRFVPALLVRSDTMSAKFQPMTQQLSHTAWQVDSAASVAKDYRKNSIAAALRAAVQETNKQKTFKVLGVTMAQSPAYCLVSDLLAIADELEAHD